MLWYNELTATSEDIGFHRNPYDTCSFSRAQLGSIDRILVYVYDLSITSESKERLQVIADTLKRKYEAVTTWARLPWYSLGLHHPQLSFPVDGWIHQCYYQQIQCHEEMQHTGNWQTIPNNARHSYPYLEQKRNVQIMHNSLLLSQAYPSRDSHRDILLCNEDIRANWRR